MYNLPSQLTLFVGREDEIAEINQLLANPDCRLLTVAGVGGIGKTRLALQSASQVAGAFADGVHFVALQPVTSSHFFVATVADVLGFTPAGPEDVQTQLLKYLSKKEVLIILDNFEHLLQEVDFLIALLQAAPLVKLLVTSREVLHLQEEWIFPIQGLSFPTPTALSATQDAALLGGANLGEYSAVRLFAERTRRVRRGFSLEKEAADVVAICQMVEGMPLAIELAATWTQSLSCRTIADEIRHNLDFLATEWRNVPDRQRSMRAVFDYSHNLLTPTEQMVFRRMSVFRGGFHRKAAEAVAGASLTTLGSLVSHSLLRWEPVGRYQLHELLRQYAEEKLREIGDEKQATDEAHCLYFTDFLRKRFAELIGGKQLEAVSAIDSELENIRVAWQYAVETRNIEAIGNAIQPFALYYVFRSRNLEGTRIFEEAIEQFGIFRSDDPEHLLLAIRFQEIAWYYIRMGDFEKAQKVVDRVQFAYKQLELSPIYGAGTDPLFTLSILATIRGQYDAAIHYGEEALQESFTHPHATNRQFAQYALASASLAQGNYQAALQHARAAYDTTQETQDRWFMAYCLLEMGNVESAMRDHEQARKHLEESYAIRKEYNDPEGMAVSLSYLGEVALRQEQFPQAQACYERSVALYGDINDRGGLARSLDGLGNALCARGDYERARQHLSNALKLATEIDFVSLICTIITSVGDLLVQTGNRASGIALMAQISRHPNSTTINKSRARQLLAQYRPVIEPELYEIVTAQDHIEMVNTLAEMAKIELSAPDLLTHQIERSMPDAPTSAPSSGIPSGKSTEPASASKKDSATSSETEPIIDPLTARELEILNLIAEGLSNQQIASALFITRGTVKWYTSQIYSKLGIESRTQAIGRARELSLLS